MSLLRLATFVTAAAATFVVTDPSDQIGTIDWAADNALPADYNVAPVSHWSKPAFVAELMAC